MSWRGWWCLWVVAAAGCAPTPVKPSATPSAEAASARLARLVASEPDTFKMVHQVVGHFQGRTYPMNGYAGRRDGSFRVSAMVAVGPKLFDVAKISGRWESRIHLPRPRAVLTHWRSAMRSSGSTSGTPGPASVRAGRLGHPPVHLRRGRRCHRGLAHCRRPRRVPEALLPQGAPGAGDHLRQARDHPRTEHRPARRADGRTRFQPRVRRHGL